MVAGEFGDDGEASVFFLERGVLVWLAVWCLGLKLWEEGLDERVEVEEVDVCFR